MRGINYCTFGVFLLLLTAGCRSSAASDLDELSQKFGVTLSFSSKYRADSLTIIKKYGNNNLKLDWRGDTLNNIANPKVIVSNLYGMKWSFNYLDLDKNMPFFKKITKSVDTFAVTQIVDNGRGNRFIENGIFQVQAEDQVVEYFRTGNKPIIYKLTDSIVKAGMYLMYGRNTEYDAITRIRKESGIPVKREIVDIQVMNDTVSLLALITTAETGRIENNIDVKSSNYLFKYKNGQLIAINPIVHEVYVQDDFYILGYDFILHGDHCYIGLGREKVKSDNRVFADFKLENDRYVFAGLLKDTLPEENIEYGFGYFSSSIRKNYPYYMFVQSSSLRNVLTGKEYRLKGLFSSVLDKKTSLMKNIERHAIFNFKVDKNNIAYIVTLEDEFLNFIKYDLANDIVIEKKQLWKRDSGRSIPYIDKWDFNYVYYWEGKYIVRQKIS